jgi:diaminohydroxyphosphoribosylaminopyrimidine deaminase / 5-amino-6-(5-phosphoribosylamino)uracil reductase
MPIAADDIHYMAEALRLARLGIYSTSPNPRVGCIIVKNGAVIGSGFHQRAGGPHAESAALAAAHGSVAGATVYVSLEPCSHHGRTPPCADALIAAGVARVVIAAEDPNPLVAGEGIARLRAAGIAVDQDVCTAEARELNAGFFRRMQTGLPLVRCKLAMSLDGRTAMASGESRWITGEAARADVQRWRARSCAVITGSGTLLTDDPQLTVRADAIDGLAVGRQPVRVVVDSRLRTPAGARIFGSPGEVVVATGKPQPDQEKPLIAVGATIMHLPDAGGRVDLRALLARLADAQCNEVLIEAGPVLAGAALSAGLVDELVIYVAPVLMGSLARPMFELPLTTMAERLALDIQSITAIGNDWRIIARTRRSAITA